MIDKVKIGNMIYEIEEVDCIRKHDSLLGEISYLDSLIQIDRESSDCVKKETLLHEIVHGIEHFLDLNLEEEQVVGLGRGLAMVFMDNPQLLEYISRN